ncbi:MAG TPA: outer membrane beta-barrel protein [Cytophagaceae bacterium]|jgi:hypothetical protein|nr:outer membrane beta-barrel protein [Cytophagaceae bacterium]
MRKITLLLPTILLAIVFSAAAQLKIGATYFPQLSSTSSIIPFKKDILNNHNLPTFTSGAGALFTYDSHVKPFGVQLGILYSSQNQKFIYTYQINDKNYHDDNNKLFDYLKFSLLARKSGYVSKFVKAVFFAGPQFSYLLHYRGGLTVYEPNVYFDLPPTSPNVYFKKYTIDAVIGYSLEYAIHKNFDVFASLRLDYGLNNIEQTGAIYNNVKVFTGGGAHQMTLALQIGGYYVFHRKDHLLLPGNSWRYRNYKKRKITGRK